MISGTRIKQAREIRGLNQAELAELVGLHQSNIARLEQGFYQPLDPIIQGIAMATGFPIAFFEHDPEVEFPSGSLMYRKRASLRSPQKSMLRQIGSLLFEIGIRLGNEVGKISLKLPPSSGDPVIDAQRIRENLGFSAADPITNLIRAVELTGVFVIAIHLEIDEHDAFSLWAKADQPLPVLVVSSGKSGDRLRFSVAHELGHVMLHRGLLAAGKVEEREANAFASELLLPSMAMKLEMVPPLNLIKLAELKARWGVSIQALLMRALHLQVITMRQYKYLFQQITAKGWRTKEPVEIPIERPRLLRQMIERAYGKNTSLRVVADDLKIPEKLLAQVLNAHAGSLPIPAPTSGKRLIPFNVSRN